MATNPKITPSRQRAADGNTKHMSQRPTVTPVVSLNGYRLANSPKAASPQQPRMPQTRLTSAHNVLGLVTSTGTPPFGDLVLLHGSDQLPFPYQLRQQGLDAPSWSAQ